VYETCVRETPARRATSRADGALRVDDLCRERSFFIRQADAIVG